MSNKQDNSGKHLDAKLSDAKATAEKLLQNRRKSYTVETVKTRTPKDYGLWIIAIACFILAAMVNTYLPGYWVAASDIWVRIAIIIGLVIFSIICIAFTSHGKDFKVLVKDAGIELKRVTWPTKNETIHWTWLSIVFMVLFGILVWILDMFFNKVVGFIIG